MKRPLLSSTSPASWARTPTIPAPPDGESQADLVSLARAAGGVRVTVRPADRPKVRADVPRTSVGSTVK